MGIDDVLRYLGADPAALAPAPSGWARREASARLAPPPPPCAGCGWPARATTAADLPDYGLRGLDRCRDCFLATVGMTPAPVPATEEQVLADVRAAAFEAGVSLVILVDRAEGARRG
ncbi:hypothetical protein [Streptomyces sp. NPDC005209]|uniref:hypothetical protein n=1 Tax=Streptomyces sp. NPDC005209 TaxID=3156715 RepID=UPI0033B21BB2